MVIYIPEASADMLIERGKELHGLTQNAPFNDFQAPDLDFLFICFTNRSGSTYLSQLLATTNEVPIALEMFNTESLLGCAETQNSSDLDQVIVSISVNQSWGGRVIFKISIDQILFLAWVGILKKILKRSRFVVIERIDRLSQAISWQIAKITQSFSSIGLPAPTNIVETALDWETTKRDLDGIIKAQQITSDFFATNGIPYYLVQYEHLLENPKKLGDAISYWLGIEHPDCKPANVTLSMQKTELNANWKADFLRHARGAYAEHLASLFPFSR